MSTIHNKLIGVAFSAAILGGAVALADPSGAPIRQAASTLVAGSEGAAVFALVDSTDGSTAQPQPIQLASAQPSSSFAAQTALLRAPAAPRSR